MKESVIPEIKKQGEIPFYKEKEDLIKKQIADLQGEFNKVEEQLEPLYDVWDKYNKRWNIQKDAERTVARLKNKEIESKADKIIKERNSDPSVIKMGELKEKRNEINAKIVQLTKELRINSLNEFDSEINKIINETYAKLDLLTKEHTDPLEKYGVNYESAKNTLGIGLQNDLEKLEHKINVLERIQGEVKDSLKNEYLSIDIQRLRKQLTEVG